jgi:hypothetical protein
MGQHTPPTQPNISPSQAAGQQQLKRPRSRIKRGGRGKKKKKKEGGEFQQHYWAEIFGGQQGDGRVFNTKFSKALHA